MADVTVDVGLTGRPSVGVTVSPKSVQIPVSIGGQGPPGQQGPAGPQGNPGPPGATGSNGQTGAAGPPGPTGAQGPLGNTGPQGLAGAQGQPGATGAQGPAGIQGLQGNTGPQGPTGSTGSSGPQGVQGAAGTQGPPGAGLVIKGVVATPANLPTTGNTQGDLWIAQSDGNGYCWDGTKWVNVGPMQGPVGATGPQGPQGPQGLQGVKGDTGATGATGTQGPIGLTGAQGPTGNTGAIGLTGATGPTGAQGPQGPQGNTGATGLTGSTGSAGPQGQQGIQGAQGPQGNVGATGPKGDSGATGAVGLTGQGYSWRGAWLNTTLYSPYDTVSRSGSSYVCVLPSTGNDPAIDPTHWQIVAQMGATGAQGPIGATGPQGNPGTPGATGATGATGPQGSQGVQGPSGPPGGASANTTLTAAFSMPAVNTAGVASVVNAGAFSVGGIVYINPIGYLNVQAVNALANQLTLQNLGVTGNQPPGSSAPSGNAVTGVGPQGPQGVTGSQGPQGPQGPQGIQGGSAVSVNANNKAILGTDSLILVQGTAAGVAATTHAQTVSGDDPQLTNARTPTTHGSTHLNTDAIPDVTLSAHGLCVPPDGTTIQISGGKLIATASGGGDMLKSVYDTNANNIVDNAEAVLGHAPPASGDATAAQVVLGNDSRLANARTPTAHASTHNLGGSDVIAPDWTQVANKPATFAPAPHEASHVTGSDLIPLASGSTNGLMRQVSGNTTDFIDGTNNSQPLQPVIWSVRLRSYNAIGNGNPTFEIDQRNAAAALTNPTDGTFIQDRWAASKNLSTGAVNVARQNSLILVPGTNFAISQNFQRFTVGTAQAAMAAGNYYGFIQYVEGPRWRELSSDVHSISLLVRSSVAGLQFSTALASPDRTRALTKLSPALSANTWTLVSLPNLPLWSGGNFVATPGSQGYFLSVYLASGSTFIGVNDAWQNGDIRGAVGMSNFLSTAGATFDIAFIQHEPGALCTTPIDCPFSENLFACKRYYQKTYDYTTAISTNVIAGMCHVMSGAPTLFFNLGKALETEMAKTPAINVYNHSTGAANSIRDTGGVDHAISAINNPGTKSPFWCLTTSTSVSLNLIAYTHYTADTGW